MHTPIPWRRLAGRALAPVARALTPGPRILFYHRFGVDDRDPRRLPIAQLEAQLDYLTRHFEPVTLAELALRPGLVPRRSVALTVDDGYPDFAELAYPVFARYRVPVTLFAVSRFVAGETWLWFDRLHWMVSATTRQDLVLGVRRSHEVFDLSTPAAREQAWDRLATRCLRLAPAVRETLFAAIAVQLRVEVPRQAPAACRSLTAAELRELDPRTVQLASHTRSHPILSTLTRAQIREEIVGAEEDFQRLRLPTRRVFCYPNGKPGDYDPRAVEILREAGYDAAVTAVHGRLRPGQSRFEWPRLGASSHIPGFHHEMDGLSEWQARLRGTGVAAPAAVEPPLDRSLLTALPRP